MLFATTSGPPIARPRVVTSTPATRTSSFSVRPSSPAPVVLSVKNLHKHYGSKVHALNGVTLELRRGEVLGFLGPNGAGKTTFTKCVVGFLRPSAGTVHLFGIPVHEDPRRVLGRVGVVPDQFDFYTSLNGYQHLRYYGRLYGIPEHELERRVEDVLRTVGMTEHAKRKVREYSHGMKQRLCIAQALINDPDFLIFDEPSNGLDPRGAFEVRELIKGLAAQGKTIFLSSHILSEVEQVCTRVAILSKGRILVQAPVEDLRRRLANKKKRVTVTLEQPLPGIDVGVVRAGGATHATLDGNRLVADLDPHQGIPDLVAALARQGARILSVQEDSAGLEQIFLDLTRGEGGM